HLLQKNILACIIVRDKYYKLRTYEYKERYITERGEIYILKVRSYHRREQNKRLNVTINDQHYIIVGQDNPEHIRYVAHLVDERLKELASKIAGLDTTRKAILTAVNIMHEKVQVEEENERLRQEINQLKNSED